MAISSERRLRVAEKRVKKCLKRDKIDAKSFEIVSTRTRSDHFEFYVSYQGNQSGKNNVGSTPSAQQTTKKVQSALRGMLEEVGIKQSCRRAWEEVSFLLVDWGDGSESATAKVERDDAEGMFSTWCHWDDLLCEWLDEATVDQVGTDQEAITAALNKLSDSEIEEGYRNWMRRYLEQWVYDEYYISFGEYPEDEEELTPRFEGTANFDRALVNLVKGRLEWDKEGWSEGVLPSAITGDLVSRMLGAKSLDEADTNIATAILSGEIEA